MPSRPSDEPTRSSTALLLVDAGNTRVKFGLFDGSGRDDSQLPACVAFTAPRVGAPDFWTATRSALTFPARPQRTLLTGSNPLEIERLVATWPADWTAPRVLTDRTRLPIEIDVDEPQRVGIDRLLDAIAANVLRPPDSPALIIDVGTATTVNAVAKSGAFVGGAILPGPELCARALHQYTAVLPEVSPCELSKGEPPVIGRNTEDAIRSGIYWGHWQAVLGYCERMKSSLDCPPDPLVLLTGGAAHLYAGRIPFGARFEEHLTLQGLAVAALRLLADEGEP